jgi:hypothetical protein
MRSSNERRVSSIYCCEVRCLEKWTAALDPSLDQQSRSNLVQTKQRAVRHSKQIVPQHKISIQRKSFHLTSAFSSSLDFCEEEKGERSKTLRFTDAEISHRPRRESVSKAAYWRERRSGDCDRFRKSSAWNKFSIAWACDRGMHQSVNWEFEIQFWVTSACDACVICVGVSCILTIDR